MMAVVLLFLAGCEQEDRPRVSWYLVVDITPSVASPSDTSQQENMKRIFVTLRKAFGLLGPVAKPVWRAGDHVRIVRIKGAFKDKEKKEPRELYISEYTYTYEHDSPKIRTSTDQAFVSRLNDVTTLRTRPDQYYAAFSTTLRKVLALLRHDPLDCKVIVLVSDFEDSQSPNNPELQDEEFAEIRKKALVLIPLGMNIGDARPMQERFEKLGAVEVDLGSPRDVDEAIRKKCVEGR